MTQGEFLLGTGTRCSITFLNTTKNSRTVF